MGGAFHAIENGEQGFPGGGLGNDREEHLRDHAERAFRADEKIAEE